MNKALGCSKAVRFTNWELELIRNMVEEEQDRWFEEGGTKLSRRMALISNLVDKLRKAKQP